ncbi:MAG: N-formylglutamate amidohydrolase [Cytophagaceae bacterium]|jgi:predicted N-formylglutamate amidohydrolase|nr:N-formylglutamate amidohydrolase [Cytophagaceae bacterium]
MKLLLSCEHGGNQIPEKYAGLFTNAGETVNTHRGFDDGALSLFRAIEQRCHVIFSIHSEVTRLLVDSNRSIYRSSLFSEFTKTLDHKTKNELLQLYYYPFRRAFREQVVNAIDGGDTVFHLSVHAFTPEINGKVRDADIGLLFNPAHGTEKRMAVEWRRILKQTFPKFVIRFNYPFLGKPDGHVAPLRKEFGNKYTGFEIELNSKHANIRGINEKIAISVNKLMRK